MKNKLKSKTNWGDIVFFSLMMAIPIVQFCIFYIGVNINSILLSIKEYSTDTGSYEIVYFDNFKKVFSDFFGESDVLRVAFKNSLIFSFFNLVVGISLGLLFSYSIYKKCFGHEFYKIMLFMPSILSSVVMAMMFNYFVERAVPEMILSLTGEKIGGFLSTPDSTFSTLVFYTIWVSFGSSMLMYVGAMNNIDESMIEAGVLDGTNSVTEFLFIVFPSIYSTFIVFFTTALIAVFTHQMNLYSFYGGSARFDLYTLGYYLYRETQGATLSQYPYLAAMGIIFTLIATPVTLGLKRLLEKIGPSTDGGR